DHFAHGDFTERRFMGFVVFVALQHYTLIRGRWSYALKTMSYRIGAYTAFCCRFILRCHNSSVTSCF
ncbi:MAG: hypothetical protein KZQ62_12880, partial [Candidatus Thiodiazotropha sp. (ex Lucinoma aequizonata)]|nr:hypothetical protein [Candidatus Thiodiazotropha sp. (ex Lucinoma aequizonata)]MCU7897828.1 hypothetical protein [Candidatus Thiodiazotropha sp. (ex Lucinoma aequizonata)]